MNIAIILAGGKGLRMNMECPKQYIKVNDKMIIEYCMEKIFSCKLIDYVIVIAEKEWQKRIEEAVKFGNIERKNREKFIGFALPGANRQLSIYSGLKYIGEFYKTNEITSDNDDIVLIHDAARPLVSLKLIEDCFRAFQNSNVEGVLPVLAMKDTIYMSNDGNKISDILDRNKLFAGQAPEAFLYDKYLKANESLLPDGIKKINGSTEPAIIAGMNIVTIPGDENNFKITTQNDIIKFRSML